MNSEVILNSCNGEFGRGEEMTGLCKIFKKRTVETSTRRITSKIMNDWTLDILNFMSLQEYFVNLSEFCRREVSHSSYSRKGTRRCVEVVLCG